MRCCWPQAGRGSLVGPARPLPDRALASLEELSLSRCLFLRGDFFPALRACTALRSLDLADCGLGLAINPGAVEALAGLSTLTHLDLSGGNGVGDEAMAALAQMPALR